MMSYIVIVVIVSAAVKSYARGGDRCDVRLSQQCAALKLILYDELEVTMFYRNTPKMPHSMVR